MFRHDWRRTLDLVDRHVRDWMALHAILLLRWSLGIVFLWFGALKFAPGLSSAEPLATVTMTKLCFGVLQPEVSRVLLAAWESVIGLALLAGRWLRGTLLLMGLQMLGTMTFLILLPSETWEVFPFVPTMEGQYILKNLVLISSALVIGATVRSGVLISGAALTPVRGSSESGCRR